MRKILWVIFVIVGISSAATVLEDNFHDAVTVGWTEDTDGGNSGTVTFGYGEPADTMLRLNCTDGRYDNLIYADPAPSNQIVYYEWYDSIASTNLADGNSFALIRTGPASNDVQIRTNLYNYGGVYYVRTMYRNNASAYDTSDTNGASINLGQKYRFRVLCDATNDIGAFYIDGTEIYNEELSLGKAFSFIQVGCIAPYNTHDDEYDRYVGHLLITDDGFIDPVEECDPMTVDSIRGIDSVAFGETAFVHLTGAKSYGTAAFLGFSVDTSFYDPDSCGVIMSKSGDGYLVITDSCGSQDSILLNVSRNEYAIDRSPYPINNEYAGTTDDHYLLGGSKMVRNDHTVISLVPQGEVEVTFRSFADGDSGTWIPIDTNSHSGCIVIDSSNRVHHFYRDSEGKRRLMWLNYPIDTTAMPEAVKIDSLESTSGYAFYDTYLFESATVNSKNEIYVTMTGLTDDSCFIWKYDGSWGSRLPVPDVVDGYQPDLKCGVDDTLFLVVSRSNEAVASKYHFIGKSYDGSSWSVNEYGPGQVNLVILPSRDDSIHLFAQTSTGLQHRLSTDNAETWGSWSLIQSTSGYADPSVALDSDWKIYVNMRNDPADDDVYYNYFMLSEDGGENFAFIDSLTTGEDEVGAKTGIRYQMWYNGGGPIERIWKQDIGAVNQIYYDRYDGAELADAPIDSFTLTITSATNGSVILDPVSGKVASGETVTATATANSGFQFDGWTGDTTTSESEITWSSMDEGKTIAAVFSEIVDPDSFTVTLSLAGTGTGDTALSPLVAGNKYQTGTEITLTSTPDPFNKFVASDTVPSTEYVLTIISDTTLNVTFDLFPTYTIDTTIVSINSGAGTWTITEGLGPHDSTTTIHYVSELSGISTFGGYSGTISSSELIYSFDIAANHVDTATFQLVPTYDISIVDSTNCSIEFSHGPTGIDSNTSVTLTITPDPYFALVPNDTVGETPFVFTITKDTTLEISIRAYPTYAITVDSTNCSVTSSLGFTGIDSSRSTDIVCTPDAGYGFVTTGGDTTTTDSVFSWVINANKTISFEVALIPVVDSIRNRTTYGTLSRKYARIGDTLTAHGVGFGDSTASSELYLNSTGTESITSFLRWDGTNDSCVFIVPIGTVRGGRKSRVVNGENLFVSAIPDSVKLKIINPGGD